LSEQPGDNRRERQGIKDRVGSIFLFIDMREITKRRLNNAEHDRAASSTGRAR
jgi:hypothetical protein